MRIIFSRNRAAQLDLLLRSLERFSPREDTVIVWYATAPEFSAGYAKLGLFEWTQPWRFEETVRDLIDTTDDCICFLCDDDVAFRPMETDPRHALDADGVICFSWRLDYKCAEGVGDWTAWRWTDLPRTDNGYPGSIDGHVFSAPCLRELLRNQAYGSPTFLETVLARRCDEYTSRWPMMAAGPEQAIVGIPVNRVSEPSGCPFGERFPQTAEMLNARFLDGERISLDHACEELLRAGKIGCHHEIQFAWEAA